VALALLLNQASRESLVQGRILDAATSITGVPRTFELGSLRGSLGCSGENLRTRRNPEAP